MALDLLPPPTTHEDEESGAPAAGVGSLPPVHLPHSRLPRLLSQPEIESVRHLFLERGQSLPDPNTSFFVGTVAEDGHVTAFLVCQLRIHAEPLWLEPGSEHQFRAIAHAAERIIAERVGDCDVYLFAPDGKVSRMAERIGLTREPWTVFSKHIVGAAQSVKLTVQPQKETLQ